MPILVPTFVVSTFLCVSSAWDVIIYTDVYAQLLPENLGQRATIPHVDPVALSTTLLGVHALFLHNPVESLRSGDGRTEPDLLVRGLLVEHIVVLLGLDFEDASLEMLATKYL
jgi:hypothetical protein